MNPQALDARRGVCRHGDAHARHRGGQHRPLPDRRGPRRRPQRPAVGRRRLHARARRDRADLRLARRPLRSSPAVRRAASPSSPSLLPPVPRPRASKRSSRLAPCRASARRSCSPSRSPCSPNAFPGAKERAGALAAYGAADRRLVRRRPARRRRADQRPGLAVDLPRSTCRSASPCLWITRAYVAESRDPAARRVDVPGQIALGAGLFLLVLALLRGNEDGWTSTPIVAALAVAAALLGGLRGHRGAGARADAAARALPQPQLRRRAGRGARDLGLVLRDLPLRHAVPAAGAGALGDRGRARVPAGHAGDLHRLGRHRGARREGLGAGDDRRSASRSWAPAWR